MTTSCSSDVNIAYHKHSLPKYHLLLLDQKKTLRSSLFLTKINVGLICRICAGTWNVAGRLPHNDLDIEEWLDMEEPADIYVLG